MNSMSPSAAESASEVTAALAPRAMEMSADIYQLIVREIPQLRIAAVLASYIDKVSEEVVPAYESEKENWLGNQSVARAARVRACSGTSR